jgi:hypothetical protein
MPLPYSFVLDYPLKGLGERNWIGADKECRMRELNDCEWARRSERLAGRSFFRKRIPPK